MVYSPEVQPRHLKWSATLALGIECYFGTWNRVLLWHLQMLYIWVDSASRQTCSLINTRQKTLTATVYMVRLASRQTTSLAGWIAEALNCSLLARGKISTTNNRVYNLSPFVTTMRQSHEINSPSWYSILQEALLGILRGLVRRFVLG